MKILGWLVVFAVLIALAMKALERPTPHVNLSAARDTVWMTDVRYLQAKAEALNHESGTAAAVEKAKASALLASVVDPGRIAVRLTPSAPPSIVIVPVQIAERIARQDAAIDSLTILAATRKAALDAADSSIHARDVLIAKQDTVIRTMARAGRWGLGGTFGYGAGGKGTGWQATVGVTYDIPLPRIRLPFGLPHLGRA